MTYEEPDFDLPEPSPDQFEYDLRVCAIAGYIELIPDDGHTHVPSYSLKLRTCPCKPHKPEFDGNYAIVHSGGLFMRGFYTIRHRPFCYHPSRVPARLPEEPFAIPSEPPEPPPEHYG